MVDRVISEVRVVGGRDEVCDVVVSGARVQAVVPTGSLERVDAEVVPGEGRWLGPGLWDAHVHMELWAQHRGRPDASGCRSAEEAARLAAGLLASRITGDVLVLRGFGAARWPDQPTVEMLDSHTGGTPVVLISQDIHSGWFNSAALARYAPGRQPTGLLRENDFYAAVSRVETESQSTLDEQVRQSLAAAAELGVVGVVDFQRGPLQESWRRRAEAGQVPIKVHCSVYPDRLEEVIDLGFCTGDPIAELVWMGPLKVLVDGSLNTGTAWCTAPYPGTFPPDHGVLVVPPAELMDLLARARRAGLDCAVHAIGDQAVAIALDAFTTSGARGSIEHAQLIGPRDPDRFASLGLVASIQPQHALDDRDVADELWADRTDRAFAYRTLWSAGVRLALGSDAPVAPLDPWSTLSAAEHRTRAHLPPWHPEQCLPREVAWAASVRGRVAPGEPADLILLDQDPLRAEDIAAVRPVATMVAGRFVAGPCCQS